MVARLHGLSSESVLISEQEGGEEFVLGMTLDKKAAEALAAWGLDFSGVDL
jgi:hypothetical protein